MKTRVVKFPMEVLNNLQQEFPTAKNQERIIRIYNDHLELKEIKEKLNKAGRFIYGGVWKQK